MSLLHACFVGMEHHITFCCCQCEPTPVTMVRARLWPASPRFPQLAFTFELLDWAEALLLECQVALGDLCKALYFKCPHLVNKVFCYICISQPSLVLLRFVICTGPTPKNTLLLIMASGSVLITRTLLVFSFSFLQRKDIYPAMIDAFEEYRYVILILYCVW